MPFFGNKFFSRFFTSRDVSDNIANVRDMQKLLFMREEARDTDSGRFDQIEIHMLQVLNDSSGETYTWETLTTMYFESTNGFLRRELSNRMRKIVKSTTDYVELMRMRTHINEYMPFEELLDDQLVQALEPALQHINDRSVLEDILPNVWSASSSESHQLLMGRLREIEEGVGA